MVWTAPGKRFQSPGTERSPERTESRPYQRGSQSRLGGLSSPTCLGALEKHGTPPAREKWGQPGTPGGLARGRPVAQARDSGSPIQGGASMWGRILGWLRYLFPRFRAKIRGNPAYPSPWSDSVFGATYRRPPFVAGRANARHRRQAVHLVGALGAHVHCVCCGHADRESGRQLAILVLKRIGEGLSPS